MEQEIERLRRELAQAEARIHRIRANANIGALIDGTYYFSIEEVLSQQTSTESISFQNVINDNGILVNSFCRTRYPQVQNYPVTMEAYNQKGSLPAPPVADGTAKAKATEATDNSSLHKSTYFRVDIFGNQICYQECAHLIPGSLNHSCEWWDTACCVFGIDPNDATWDEVMRLLRGGCSQPIKDNNSNDNNNNATRIRMDNTGLVHSVCNKLYLTNQKNALDGTNPTTLIIPILTREQCLNWNGESYQAIVLVGAIPERNQTAAQGWQNIQPLRGPAVSNGTDEDLRIALTLLREHILYMVKMSNLEPSDPSRPDDYGDFIDTAMERKEECRANLTGLGSFQVPTRQNNSNWDKDVFQNDEQRAICRITFRAILDDEDNNTGTTTTHQHPAPDPLLLLAHATNIWSTRNGFRLRSSAAPTNDNDTVTTESFLLGPIPPCANTDKMRAMLAFKVKEVTIEDTEDGDHDTVVSGLSDDLGEEEDMPQKTDQDMRKQVSRVKDSTFMFRQDQYPVIKNTMAEKGQ